jgi:hypothetical protein
VLRTTHRPRPTAAASRPRRATAVLAGMALAAPAVTFLAAPATAATGSALEGACTDDDGVTVVVDSTALGGGIDVGCAPQGGVTGTEALLAAGFTEARDPSGFICAIDGLPDPCPTEFTGEYWSYWSAAPGDGDWESYQEGSDTAVTAPGAVEGWRYGDGAAGPDVALPVVAASQAPPAEEATTQDGAAADDGAVEGTATAAEEQGPAVPLVIALALLAALAVAAVVVARRRSAQTTDAPAEHAARDADVAGTRSS